jgi:hypothetical protein
VVQAEAALLKAVAIQEENGERPELARTLVIYADLLRTSGQEPRAREVAERATTMFRDMGMDWDLDHSARILEGR